MWSPWGRSSPRVRGGANKPSFSCSSFKDVHRLYSDDGPTSPRNSAAEPSFSHLVERTQPENENPNPHRHRQPAPAFPTKKVFHRVRVASSLLRDWPTRPGPVTPVSPSPQLQLLPVPSSPSAPAHADPLEKPKPLTPAEENTNRKTPPVARITVPGSETRIVVYYTSLRVIRPTFEACRTVQSILSGFRVTIDERDVAKDSGLLDEVRKILGTAREKLTLPIVFVGGRYIGGAEEVRELHEIGELKKLVEGLPAAEPGVCDTCGGFRFVLCTVCNGSQKVYSDKVGFRSCSACNENGLIKCPSCYPTALVPR